ncbi:unnamed protein product, partial [Iphiclides podalirius]
MMSKKQLACMLALHIVYLLVGASIFYHIESPVEVAQRAEEKLERLEIQNLLYENYIPNDPVKQDSILRKLSDYCGKSMFNYTTEDEEPPFKWDFYHSFFFSYTVVSTIGYGNLAPTTHLSRILMIFYGLFGIPINGILLANLGEYFGLQLISTYRKYKKRNEKRADNLDYFFNNLGMLGQIMLYLIPGFLFFIFLPACIFVVFEGWDYVAAIYYAFVTLTTIGFGDLVAGTINNGFKYGYFFTYQIFLIVWITFGLGYIVMLLGFITSGMRSERVHRLEHKLANQLKTTQNKIFQGFTKDIAIIRKIINEANLLKLKPVYVEAAPYLHRSASCPILTFDIEPRGTVEKRKRANSENITLSAKDMLRIQSDTDLLGIDKEKTFTASAIVKPAELLARVVNVLGDVQSYRRATEAGLRSQFSSDLNEYKNMTRRGRPSLFDPDLDLSSLPESAQIEVLEQTSVADLLRALAALETASQVANNTTELSSVSDNGNYRRRGSLRPDFSLPPLPNRTETDEATGPRRRRVSARAAAPQFTPTLATVVAGAELQITATAARENRMTMLNQPPPPYSENTPDEEPQQPKARRYSPAPNDLSRSTGPVPRLFSRIRKESGSSPESSSRRGSLTDIVIDSSKKDTS